MRAPPRTRHHPINGESLTAPPLPTSHLSRTYFELSALPREQRVAELERPEVREAVLAEAKMAREEKRWRGGGSGYPLLDSPGRFARSCRRCMRRRPLPAALPQPPLWMQLPMLGPHLHAVAYVGVPPVLGAPPPPAPRRFPADRPRRCGGGRPEHFACYEPQVGNQLKVLARLAGEDPIDYMFDHFLTRWVGPALSWGRGGRRWFVGARKPGLSLPCCCQRRDPAETKPTVGQSGIARRLCSANPPNRPAGKGRARCGVQRGHRVRGGDGVRGERPGRDARDDDPPVLRARARRLRGPRRCASPASSAAGHSSADSAVTSSSTSLLQLVEEGRSWRH